LTTVDVGFQRKWLWTFGDGEISEDENPTHIFTGTGGDQFTVSLSVVATTGEFDALATGVLSASLNSNERIFGVDFTNDDAWADRGPAPLSSQDAVHYVNFNGAQYNYLTNNPNINLHSAQSQLAHIELEAKLDLDIQDIQLTAHCLGFSGMPLPQNNWKTFGIITGITTAAPQIATPQILPQLQMGSPPAGHRWGAIVRFRTRTYTNSGTQGYDADEKEDYIMIGLPPVAEFDGSPLLINNGGAVQFENLSTEAVGLPTTYSWKKRISGSGDSFVEFSTEKNPSAIFTK
jgi:PKD repeat protein